MSPYVNAECGEHNVTELLIWSIYATGSRYEYEVRGDEHVINIRTGNRPVPATPTYTRMVVI